MRLRLPIALIVGVLGTALLFHSLLGQPFSSTLWADNYDARLLSWIAEWGYQVIVVRGSPLDFWNAPSFYPHTGTLAYSDSLLSLQLLYTPIRLLGAAPLTALYLSLALLCVAACMLSASAMSRLCKFGPIETALALLVLHFGLSIVGYLPHYQLFGFQLAAPFFLYTFLWIRDAQPKDLFVAALLFVLATCMAAYLLPMLVTLALICLLPFFIQSLRARGIAAQLRPLGSVWGVLIVTLLITLYLAQVRHYLRLEKSTIAVSSYSEAWLYSGKPWSLILPAKGGNSLWYTPPPHKARFGDAERAYFPGYLVLALFSFGIIRASKSSSFSEFSPHTSAFLLFLFVSAFVLALGPYVHSFRMPFFYLGHIVPGLEHVRAPGRFGILLSLPLAIFAAAGLAQLRSSLKASGKSAWICGLVALLVLVELVPSYRTFHFDSDADGAYKSLAKLLPAASPIIELPIAGGDNLKSISRITEQLHGTLIHGGRVFVGYGAKNSPEAEALAYLDLKLFRGKARFRDIIHFAEQHGVSHIIVRFARYPRAMQDRWEKALHNKSAINVRWLAPKVALVMLPGAHT
ncbi:MAG: hypothetical protein K1X79_02870 [Oligoflexia bacterium]|nr:hypothetical protein [Oligoflexia bacterium]